MSDLKVRIKRIQDSSPDKAARANALSEDIENRWLDLLAGSEGFLTSPEWRALDGREIIWGDIVSRRWPVSIFLGFKVLIASVVGQPATKDSMVSLKTRSTGLVLTGRAGQVKCYQSQSWLISNVR